LGTSKPRFSSGSITWPPMVSFSMQRNKISSFLPQRSFVCLISREELEEEPKYQLICVDCGGIWNNSIQAKNDKSRGNIFQALFQWLALCRAGRHQYVYFKENIHIWRTLHNFSSTFWIMIVAPRAPLGPKSLPPNSFCRIREKSMLVNMD
jgi:hypothetical protein